jgi:L-lactate utilization protein LutB
MTVTELQAARDSILQQMAEPQDIRSDGKGVTNRSLADLRNALAAIDAEINKAGGGAGVRCTITSFTKE